jgi:site-specific recombinase XerD
MTRSGSLEKILKEQTQTLATTLQPQTVLAYGSALNQFLDYLHIAFPKVRHLSQLRRDPHLLGWFRWLCEQDDPPLSVATRRRYLIQLRRLFYEVADNGHSLPSGLILSRDLPPRQHYLPRPLSPQDDQLLQQELRRTDDLHSNALLLIRLTGIRLGECIHLALDCLRPLGDDQWALHVPLGKLHTERLVPVDADVRQIISRILTLRAQAPASQLEQSVGWLLPRCGGFWSLYLSLRYAAIHAGERAGCSQRVIPHRLRHTFATEMLRLGISLPALMQLLGHKDIHMTLLYLEVTQQDLQREFHFARQNAVQRHLVPKLALPDSSLFTVPDLPGIRRALAAVRHLLEMFRRQLTDEKTSRKLRRLDKRILSVAFELNQLIPPEK